MAKPETRDPAFSIREATKSDAAEILECLRASFECYRQDYTPEGFADTVLTPETIQQRFEKMNLLVAVTPRNEIVGTIGCIVIGDGTGHLRGLAVHPDWQGAGIAAELLRAAVGNLQSRKCSRITLNTTEPLKRAMRFYEKNGFERSGKVRDFFGMPLIEYVKVISDG